MQDLKDYTQDVHYENFRKKKLLEGSPAYVPLSLPVTSVSLHFVLLSRSLTSPAPCAAGIVARP